jgi:hypothetical protein
MKLLFAPIGILAGLLAGFAAQKGFERIWAILDDEQAPEVEALDDEQAPEVEARQVSYPKLAMALLLEGAIFRLVKGVVDRGARLGFASITGRWPGEERTES